MSAVSGPRRRRPSRDDTNGRVSRDRSPGVGSWLAQCAVPSEQDVDLDALAEAAELGINTNICASLLTDLRRDNPPKFAYAQAAVADLHRQSVDSISSSAVPHREHESPTSIALPPRKMTKQPQSRSNSASRAAAEVLKPTRPPLPGSGNGSVVNSPRSSPIVSSSTDDGSFSSAITARLLKAEQLNQQLTAQLAERSRENMALRAENESLRQFDPNQAKGSAVEDALRRECDDLRNQVQQMARVLQDFGLQAPLASHGDPGRGQLNTPAGSDDSGGMTVNIQVIERRLQDLNEKLDQSASGSSSQQSGGCNHVARLSTEEQCLPVTFFADGLKLADHAFIPYDLRPAQEALKDILDGSFPRALLKEFPDGAHLRAVNRTSCIFVAWLRNDAANDIELADGGDRLRPSVGHAVQKDLRTAGDRFVAKLPERVIRGGKVCNIRASVAKQIGVAPATSSGGSGAAKSDEVSLLEPHRDASLPFAKVQVKLEAGQRVLFCMESHATIGALWDALLKWQTAHGIPRSGADGRPCALRSAFPPRSYTDRALTLEAAGLTPSATLFVGCDLASGTNS